MKTLRISLLTLLGLSAFNAQAAYFKCEAPDGDTVYQDRPCAMNAAQEELDLEDGVFGQCRGERFKGVVQSLSEPRDGFWLSVLGDSGREQSMFYSGDFDVRVNEGRYYEGYINREIVFIEGEPFDEMVLTCITKQGQKVARNRDRSTANQL